MNSNFEPEHWDRLVLLELGQEYRRALWQQNVKLRPITITFFDSKSHWGEFDPIARTISISRKLVRENQWHHVVGVLLHEVAHQYVAENHPQACQTETAHGDLFKAACKRLGVPEQFARAGFNLQSSNLDWRTEIRDEATEKILERTKKLLSLANSTNENEAQLAMEKVREIYAKYNLEHLEKMSQQNFVHLIITHNKRRYESWEKRAINLVSEHFFVTVLYTKDYDAKNCHETQAFELIGTRENVLMAEYVYHFLLQQTEFLLVQSLPKNNNASRRSRASFRIGVIDGFARKLSAQQNPQASEQEAEPSVVGRALLKFKEDRQIKDYLKQAYPKLRSARSSSLQVNDEAFSAGYSAGKAINLNKPVTESSGNRGFLLR